MHIAYQQSHIIQSKGQYVAERTECCCCCYRAAELLLDVRWNFVYEILGRGLMLTPKRNFVHKGRKVGINILADVICVGIRTAYNRCKLRIFSRSMYLPCYPGKNR